MSRRAPFVLALCFTVGACSSSNPAQKYSTAGNPPSPAANAGSIHVTTSGAAGASATANLVPMSGNLIAPAGVIASGGGNVVATGAGNVVSQGAGNVVSQGAGNMRVLLSVDEHPLATAVWAYDQNGVIIDRTESDANGNYTLEVPEKKTYKVIAFVSQNGKAGNLVTMGQGGNRHVDISMASTCVAVRCLQDMQKDFSAFDAAAFASMEADMKPHMAAMTKVPDFSSLGTLSAQLSDVISAEVWASMDAKVKGWVDAAKAAANGAAALGQAGAALGQAFADNASSGAAAVGSALGGFLGGLTKK